MRADELQEILGALDAEAVQKLAARLEIGSGSRAALLGRIAKAYARSPYRVFENMRRGDLYRCLGQWMIETDHGTYELTGLSRASQMELLAVAHKIMVERWIPTGDRAQVSWNGAVTADRIETSSPQRSIFDVMAGLRGGDEREAPVTATTSSAYEDFETARGLPSEGEGSGLAPFQQEAVGMLRERLGRRGRALLCLPTGGGKTRTALHLLLHDYVARRRKVLWITHRLDLLDQVHDDLRDSVWQIARRRQSVRVSRVHGGVVDVSGDFVLASAMTLVRNGEALEALNRKRDLAIVVYDEAHRLVAKQTLAVVQHLVGDGRHLLALTATPYRKDPEENLLLERELGTPAYVKTFGDLVKTGFLARPTFMRLLMTSTAAMQLSERDVEEIRREGDFTSAVLSALARNQLRNEEIVTHWCKSPRKYGKTIAFACDIDHADRLAGAFRRRGVDAWSLHSRLPTEERRQILRRFKDSREGPVLVNVGILTEGTNVPDTRTVLLGRPTLSRSLYMQMIGRGARGPLAVPGKTDFYVIDCVDNFGLHGLVTAGGDVALELDGIIEELSSTGDETPKGLEEPPREVTRRSYAEATLRLLLRGYAPQACTLWGELRWQPSSSAGLSSAAVFFETRSLVEGALQQLALNLRAGRFDRMPAEGLELDSAGALRSEEWTAAWTSCRDTGNMPELVSLAANESSERDVALMTLLCDQLRRHPDWSREDWAQHFSQDEALRGQVEAVFGDIGVALDALLRGAADLTRVPEPQSEGDDTAEVRNVVQDARDYSTIAFAISGRNQADALVAPPVIDVSCQTLFGVGAIVPDQEEPVRDEELQAAADRLATGDRGVEVLDHLIRIVVADQRVDAHERHVLQLVAPPLGMTLDVLDGRLAGIEEYPADAGVTDDTLLNAGIRTCHVCEAMMPSSARFCGQCGADLTRGEDRPRLVDAARGSGETRDDDSAPKFAEAAPAATVPDLAGRASDAVQTPPVPSTVRGDPRAGHEFERWFATELKERGFADVRKGQDSEHGTGRPDFEVKHEGRRMVLELKHIGPRSDVFHWSQHQVRESQRCAGDGYFLVIGRPIGNDRYELFWCARPHEVFRTRVRKICHSYELTHDVTQPPGADVWSTPTPPVSQDVERHRLEFVVTVTEGDYDALRSEGQGFDPLERWRDAAR